METFPLKLLYYSTTFVLGLPKNVLKFLFSITVQFENVNCFIIILNKNQEQARKLATTGAHALFGADRADVV